MTQPARARMARRAEKSMRAGNPDAGTYVGVRSQLLSERAERIELENSLAQAHIALETLLGTPSPGTDTLGDR